MPLFSGQPVRKENAIHGAENVVPALCLEQKSVGVDAYEPAEHVLYGFHFLPFRID